VTEDLPKNGERVDRFDKEWLSKNDGSRERRFLALVVGDDCVAERCDESMKPLLRGRIWD
jgi:hypothetical protein